MFALLRTLVLKDGGPDGTFRRFTTCIRAEASHRWWRGQMGVTCGL